LEHRELGTVNLRTFYKVWNSYFLGVSAHYWSKVACSRLTDWTLEHKNWTINLLQC